MNEESLTSLEQRVKRLEEKVGINEMNEGLVLEGNKSIHDRIREIERFVKYQREGSQLVNNYLTKCIQIVTFWISRLIYLFVS